MRFFSLLTVTVALAAPALSLTLPWKSKPYDNVHIDLVSTSNQIKKQLEALPAGRAEPIYAKTKKLVVKLAKVTKQDLDQSVKGQALFPEINRMATYVQTLGYDTRKDLDDERKELLEITKKALKKEHIKTKREEFSELEGFLYSAIGEFVEAFEEDRNILESFLNDNESRESLFDLLNVLGIKIWQKSTDNVTADEVIAALRDFIDSLPDLSWEKQQELLQNFADDLVEDS
ncbi:hypothetical protein FRC02_009473 [Tulasnella sp. 418]|nr:hypothetical protein FRC02_009473 [Tulasnella sp. 418]